MACGTDTYSVETHRQRLSGRIFVGDAPLSSCVRTYHCNVVTTSRYAALFLDRLARPAFPFPLTRL